MERKCILYFLVILSADLFSRIDGEVTLMCQNSVFLLYNILLRIKLLFKEETKLKPPIVIDHEVFEKFYKAWIEYSGRGWR